MRTINGIGVSNGGRQPPKKTRISPKNYTLTRTTDNNYHFTNDSGTTGPDAPKVDKRQTEESVKGSLAATDTSLVVPPQSTCLTSSD